MNRPAVDNPETLCTHCGLPVPTSLIETVQSSSGSPRPAERQFCCAGCRTVYAVIHDYGLDRYYDLKASQSRPLEPARSSGRDYSEFDDPSFDRLYCSPVGSSSSEGRPSDDKMRRASFYVEGVHCAACVWLLETAARVLSGVRQVRVDIGRSRATVIWNQAEITPSEIARFFDSVGYAVHPYRESEREERARHEDRALLIRIAVTGAVAGNVMLIAFALYGGALDGMAREYENLFRWSSLVLTIPAVIFGAGVFFRGAWSGLRRRVLHMDLPISIGIIAGFVGGAVHTVRGVGEVYFDSITALIFLLLVGRYLQRRQQRRAAESVDLLHSLSPRRARRLASASEASSGASRAESREVLVESLSPGDQVEVLAGDVIPADGEVLAGQSSVDLSLLTGESEPVPVEAGARVFGGTVSLSGRLVVVIDRVGEDSRVGQLLQQVEECSLRRSPVVQLADKIAGGFVAIVILLAGGTALLWSWLDPAQALDHTLALLVVSCPCALGLATPLAVTAAIGRAARAGLLIKGGDVFERLQRPGVIYLDKTGTLTEGRLSVTFWEGSEETRAAVRALEQHSSHPIALALCRDFDDAPSRDAVSVEQIQGAGIRGQVEGRSFQIGSPAHAAKFAHSGPAWELALERVRSRGWTPVFVVRDQEVVALAGLGDPVRSDAAPLLARLRQLGWTVGILSGDDPAVVDRVGEGLGVPEELRLGGRTPEDKLQIVESERERGSVVMVGDGVNDAAALAAATVGIGVRGGAEACLAAADVYLNRSGILPIAELLVGSQRTLGVIRRNVVFSLFYNVLGASLAVAGMIHPLVAAILMPVSSLTVVTSSFRNRAFARAVDSAAENSAEQGGGQPPARPSRESSPGATIQIRESLPTRVMRGQS